MAGNKPVWVLLGQHTGDNNQVLRLATELGLPFRRFELNYNALSRLSPQIAHESFATLDDQSRQEMKPPWPRLVLGVGNRSVPPALAIRRLSGGKSKLVRLGNPRIPPENFDLVITTAQYPVPDAPNVLRLPIGISTAAVLPPTIEESNWLEQFPRPHRLLLIGGDTFMWHLTPGRMAAGAETLRRKSGGSVIAVSSARSAKPILQRVAAALAGSEHGLVFGRFPRYPVLLHDADEIYVTADSAAMVSDAVATGKPVGLVMPGRTASGRLFYALQKLGMPVPVRDIRSFWAGVQSQGLVGTLERPVAGSLSSDPLATAVSAVRELLAR